MNVRTPTPTGSAQRDEQADIQAVVSPKCERVDFDRYVVSHDGPIGYIEAVPPVFVCYLGHPYAQAEEVAQVHEFDRAVRLLDERAARSRQRPLAG